MKMASSFTTLVATNGCRGLSLPHQAPLRAEQHLLVAVTHTWQLCLVAVSCWWLGDIVAGLVGT